MVCALKQHITTVHCVHCLPFVFSCSYKFTLDELYPLLESVKLRSESYKNWLCAVQDIVENNATKKRGADHFCTA